MILQKLPQVLDDQLGCAGVSVLPQALVDSQDVNQLVSQVVLGTVPAVEGYRGANGNRRHWQDLHDGPLRATRVLVHA